MDDERINVICELGRMECYGEDYSEEELKALNYAREMLCRNLVERSKIDKAIEEINDAPVLFVELPLGKHQVLRKDVVLDILKRNIGE